MIIAILEDKKGFRKTIQLSHRLERIIIRPPFIPEVYQVPMREDFYIVEEIEFNLDKELEAGKVYLFKER